MRRPMPSFVVQKHEATHLHYDFRLEHKGVLLSWAVPKGPPLRAGVRRLAVHVEDHPLSYGSFEGIIPEGQYGAGRVTIWDKGSYDLRKPMNKKHIAITIHGMKMKGDYDLVHMREKLWLLIKHK